MPLTPTFGSGFVRFGGNIIGAGICAGSDSVCGSNPGTNDARANVEGVFFGGSGRFLGLTFHGNSPVSSVGAVRIFVARTVRKGDAYALDKSAYAVMLQKRQVSNCR